MRCARAPSFLSYLRAYFHQRRTYVRKRRVVRSCGGRPRHPSSRFTLELIESRVLLNAAPVVEVGIAAECDPVVLSTQSSALVGDFAVNVGPTVTLESPDAGGALASIPG